MVSGGADVIIIEIKCTVNVMPLDHPETRSLTPSVEKLTSTKPVPGARKVQDRCSRGLVSARRGVSFGDAEYEGYDWPGGGDIGWSQSQALGLE